MTGQVYAVASGKGGVGKTTTVVNLGVALRARDHTVALVDADLGMANLATHLDIEGEPTLHDVLAGTASVEAALVEEAEGFVVLPGSRELAGFAAADPSSLGEVLETLAASYDYVLVDTGAGLSYEDVLPLGLVDEIVLVTTPDPAAVGDAEKTAELGGMVEGAVRGVVVTYADAAAGERVADELGVELLAAVPEDDAVAESTAAGTPLEAHAPESPATTAYRDLAAVLDGGGPAAEGTADEPAEADPAPADGTDGTPVADGDDGLVAEEPPGVDDATEGEADESGAEGDGEDHDTEEAASDGDERDAEEEDTAADADGSGGLFSKVTGLFR